LEEEKPQTTVDLNTFLLNNTKEGRLSMTLSSGVKMPDKKEEETKMCDSCYEEYPESEFFGLSCDHKFCKECLSENLNSNIAEGKVIKIPCMMHGCDQEFTNEDVERFGSAEIYSKYLRFKDNINVDLDPNLRWCPSANCVKYVRKRGRFRKTAQCECGQSVCMSCGAAAHGRVRCANVGNHELNEWIRQNGNVKLCPKCKFRTEKIDGCNHMTCTRCNYGWCWVCYGGYYMPFGSHFGGNPIFFCPGG
jgi:hypothetical protein